MRMETVSKWGEFRGWFSVVYRSEERFSGVVRDGGGSGPSSETRYLELLLHTMLSHSFCHGEAPGALLHWFAREGCRELGLTIMERSRSFSYRYCMNEKRVSGRALLRRLGCWNPVASAATFSGPDPIPSVGFLKSMRRTVPSRFVIMNVGE
jgi:hypothetical protein